MFGKWWTIFEMKKIDVFEKSLNRRVYNFLIVNENYQKAIGLYKINESLRVKWELATN